MEARFFFQPAYLGGQAADLRVQLGELLVVGSLGSGSGLPLAAKQAGQALESLSLPLVQLGRVNPMVSSDLLGWTHFGKMLMWENMRRSMGDVTLYESLILDPDWIHDYNRVHVAFFKKHFAYLYAQVGLPAGSWFNEDLGYKNGLLASPKVLAELMFPYYKELVEFFHTYDLPVVLHTCGSAAEALPLIIEAGFDALHPIERKAKDNDPFVFAEKCGDDLAFVGGMDVRVLETNDKETIRREVAAYIEGMKSRGARLIFASDHSISTRVSYQSYLYAVQVYREHMLY